MNAQTAPRSRRIGALLFLALQRFSQGKCAFFQEPKPGASVAAVMAASVFAADVAALAVLMVVVAAMNVRVILKNVVYEGGCNGGTQGIGAMSEGRRGGGHSGARDLRSEKVRFFLRPAARVRHPSGADDY